MEPGGWGSGSDRTQDNASGETPAGPDCRGQSGTRAESVGLGGLRCRRLDGTEAGPQLQTAAGEEPTRASLILWDCLRCPCADKRKFPDVQTRGCARFQTNGESARSQRKSLQTPDQERFFTRRRNFSTTVNESGRTRITCSFNYIYASESGRQHDQAVQHRQLDPPDLRNWGKSCRGSASASNSGGCDAARPGA